MNCKECRGTGTITLLVSCEPCAACGGTGKVAEPAYSYGVSNTAKVTILTRCDPSPEMAKLVKAFDDAMAKTSAPCDSHVRRMPLLFGGKIIHQEFRVQPGTGRAGSDE